MTEYSAGSVNIVKLGESGNWFRTYIKQILIANLRDLSFIVLAAVPLKPDPYVYI